MGSVEEHSLPSEASSHTELLFRIDTAIHKALDKLMDRINVTMATIRGERGPDPDYAENLEELQELIRQAARENAPGIKIINTKGSGNSSWPNKLIMGIAITVIAASIIGAVVTYATVASLRTQISDYIISNNQRLDSDETRIRDSERRLDRGAAIP